MFQALVGVLGDPVLSSEHVCGGDTPAGHEMLTRVLGKVCADRPDFAAWLPADGAPWRFLLLLESWGDSGDQALSRSLGEATRDLVATAARGQTAVYVSPGFGGHDYWACPACLDSGRDERRLGPIPRHIEAKLETGDCVATRGQLTFNARSRILFPPGGEFVLPNPIGMIQAAPRGTHAAPPPGLVTWLDAAGQSINATVVCFVLGSFMSDTGDYAEVLDRLADFPDVRLFVQVPEAGKEGPLWRAPSQRHHVHQGWLPGVSAVLFPRCDVVVHAGGAGTTMQVAQLGKPQMVVYVGTGGDKENNAYRVGESCDLVRRCTEVVKLLRGGLHFSVSGPGQEACAKLAAMLGSAGSEPAGIVASAIRRAASLQEKGLGNLQEIAADEMGDAGDDSKALRMVSAELRRLWTIAPKMVHTGMPTLIYKSSVVPTVDLFAFVEEFASSRATPGVIAFIGAQVEDWKTFSRTWPPPPHLYFFPNTTSALSVLHTTTFVSDFAKLVVLSCEPYAQTYGDIDRATVYDVLYGPSCDALWAGHAHRAYRRWVIEEPPSLVVTPYASSAYFARAALEEGHVSAITGTVVMYYDLRTSFALPRFAREALALARVIERQVFVVLHSPAVTGQLWEQALQSAVDGEAQSSEYHEDKLGQVPPNLLTWPVADPQSPPPGPVVVLGCVGFLGAELPGAWLFDTEENTKVLLSESCRDMLAARDMDDDSIAAIGAQEVTSPARVRANRFVTHVSYAFGAIAR